MDKKPALQLTLIIAFLICFINTSSFSEPVTPSSDYTIAADDILDIKVLQDENLTKILTVDKDGFISLPYIDKVKVAGLTPKGAAELIADRLRSGNFLLKPTVTVLIKENLGQKIMVFGLVKNPGAFYLKGKTFILYLLSKIELAKEGAAGKMVITRRDTSGKENTIEVDLYALLMNGDMSQNIQILSGDSIVISRKSTGQQIYVLGEVKNPGPYTVERDLTVLQALQMAGGFTDFADKGKAKVIRERNGVKKDIIVNLNKVRKGDKSQDITLEAGDVLVALRSWL
jgi:polysaccharide export outer membrane protein